MRRIASVSMEESVNTQTTQNILKFIKYQYLIFLSLSLSLVQILNSCEEVYFLLFSLYRENKTPWRRNFFSKVPIFGILKFMYSLEVENGSFVLCGFNGFFFYNRKGKSFPLVLYCVIKYAVGFIGFIGAAKILDLYQVFSLCPI